MSYAAAAAMGALSGLRSMLGPAIVSEAANRKIVRLRRTPLAWLASNRAARTCELLAVGELIADKLPFIPNRPTYLRSFCERSRGHYAAWRFRAAGRRSRPRLEPLWGAPLPSLPPMPDINTGHGSGCRKLPQLCLKMPLQSPLERRRSRRFAHNRKQESIVELYEISCSCLPRDRTWRLHA